MVDRQQKILLQLASAEHALTSEQLAGQMGVSSRTIKSDMNIISEVLRENGAQLVSRRNRGYSIEVLEGETFQALLDRVGLTVNRTSSRNEGERALYVARRMVASEEGVLVDDLAQELYLSRGGLRAPLRVATKFLESYRLQVGAAPGQGLTVTGEELMRRMAGTELFEIHFHTAELGHSDSNYAKWVDSPYEERQEIRHIFLRVLRDSPFTLRDIQTQWIAWYLIIARNRRWTGHFLNLPTRWVKELRTTPIYKTAQEIFEALGEKFAGFDMEEAEVAALAIFMTLGLSPDLTRPVEAMSYMANTVRNATDTIIQSVRQTTGTDLDAVPDARALLEQEIMTVAVKARYGMDGNESVDDSREDSYLQMPVELCYARLIAGEASRLLECKVSERDISRFCIYMTNLLWRVEYPIRPLRLLVVALPEGAAYARIAAEGLVRRWPELIREVIPTELYTIRAKKPEDYDAVLLGSAKEITSKINYYNYENPAAPLVMDRQERHFQRIYNTILVNAFRFEQLLPEKDSMEVREDFHCYDAEQVFQFLAARYAKDAACEARMLSLLRAREKLYTWGQKECAVIWAESALCREERLDLYRLSKPMDWAGRRVEWILFSDMPGGDLRRLKAMSVVLNTLIQSGNQWEEFARAPRENMEEILRESVQLA